jgi:hypothetical protein
MENESIMHELNLLFSQVDCPVEIILSDCVGMDYCENICVLKKLCELATEEIYKEEQ